MSVRKFVYMGATVSTGALCATAAAAAVLYTESFDPSSSVSFTGMDGVLTTLPLGGGACTGSSDGSNLTQTGCNFAPSDAKIGGRPVIATWSSCSGSGVASETSLNMTQSFGLRATAQDGTFDCSAPCGMKASTSGALDSTGFGKLSLNNPVPGPSFAVSSTCSTSQKIMLESSLIRMVRADFNIGLAAW